MWCVVAGGETMLRKVSLTSEILVLGYCSYVQEIPAKSFFCCMDGSDSGNKCAMIVSWKKENCMSVVVVLSL